MRLSSYLTYRPSGFAFRLVVPADLRSMVGSQVIKRALKTHDRTLAQAFALVLAAQYAQTFRDLRGEVMAKDGIPSSQVRRWILALGVCWAMLASAVHAQDTFTYVYTDPQGTPLAEADGTGTITARFDYMPYGSAVTVSGMSGAPNGPGYTGHVNDPDTGLIYMQARYFDPVLGRFLSVDPVGPSAGAMFGFNRYDYANNNPVNHTDPDGRQSVGETIDDNAMQAVAEGSTARGYGWAFAATAWKAFGAESVSQLSDKGLSGSSTGDKVGAGFEIASALPPVKILGEVAAIGKEAIEASKATMSIHAVEQAVDRGVKPSAVLDAITSPLKTTAVKIDSLGRPSYKAIGAKATVAINPVKNLITTVHPTSTSVAEKLLEQLK